MNENESLIEAQSGDKRVRIDSSSTCFDAPVRKKQRHSTTSGIRDQMDKMRLEFTININNINKDTVKTTTITSSTLFNNNNHDNFLQTPWNDQLTVNLENWKPTTNNSNTINNNNINSNRIKNNNRMNSMSGSYDRRLNRRRLPPPRSSRYRHRRISMNDNSNDNGNMSVDRGSSQQQQITDESQNESKVSEMNDLNGNGDQARPSSSPLEVEDNRTHERIRMNTDYNNNNNGSIIRNNENISSRTNLSSISQPHQNGHDNQNNHNGRNHIGTIAHNNNSGNQLSKSQSVHLSINGDVINDINNQKMGNPGGKKKFKKPRISNSGQQQQLQRYTSLNNKNNQNSHKKRPLRQALLERKQTNNRNQYQYQTNSNDNNNPNVSTFESIDELCRYGEEHFGFVASDVVFYIVPQSGSQLIKTIEIGLKNDILKYLINEYYVYCDLLRDTQKTVIKFIAKSNINDIDSSKIKFAMFGAIAREYQDVIPFKLCFDSETSVMQYIKDNRIAYNENFDFAKYELKIRNLRCYNLNIYDKEFVVLINTENPLIATDIYKICHRKADVQQIGDWDLAYQLFNIISIDNEYDINKLIELIKIQFGIDKIYIACDVYGLLLQNENNERVCVWIKSEKKCRNELIQIYGLKM